MAFHVFTLTIPSDQSFRDLAAEVGERYLELAGGSTRDRRLFRDALSSALDEVASPGQDVNLSFDTDAAGFRVTLRSGDRSSTVNGSLPASKH